MRLGEGIYLDARTTKPTPSPTKEPYDHEPYDRGGYRSRDDEESQGHASTSVLEGFSIALKIEMSVLRSVMGRK